MQFSRTTDCGTSMERVVRRGLRSWEIGLSLAVGLAAFVLAGFVLGPWPDLLGDEARRMGPFRWYAEAFKGFVPLAVAVAVTAGMMRALRNRPLGDRART